MKCLYFVYVYIFIFVNTFDGKKSQVGVFGYKQHSKGKYILVSTLYR